MRTAASPSGFCRRRNDAASTPRLDDWSALPVQRPATDLLARSTAEDEANGGLRREPELPDHVAIVKETTPSRRGRRNSPSSTIRQSRPRASRNHPAAHGRPRPPGRDGSGRRPRAVGGDDARPPQCLASRRR